MDGGISPAALAANRRLHEMREQLAAARGAAAAERAGAGGNASDGRWPAAHCCAPAAVGTSFAAAGDRESAASGVSGQKKNASHSQSSLNLHSPLIELAQRLAAGGALGWHSETLTRHLRAAAARDGIPPAGCQPALHDPAALENADSLFEGGGKGEREKESTPASNSPLATRHSPLIKIYPAIALGILRAERAAAGRLWLLLRHLDVTGRGMVTVAEARAALTTKDSPLRLCGRRRLRQLIAEGEGVFWAREQGREPADDRGRQTTGDRPPTTDHRPLTSERLRLLGPARVAAALGVRRLVGRPVGLPVAALLGSIGDARAQLYATFHSGRSRELLCAGEQGARGAGGLAFSPASLRPRSPASPISRAALTALSGACARSQAAYERRAGIMARANIALGERVADGAAAVVGPAEQERAWQRGRALFRLKDYRGRFGRPGAVYLAWRLPNDYGAARGQQQRPRGRQKRINRQLTDLFTKGMTGNGAPAIEKRFFSSVMGAVKAVERCSAAIPACVGRGRKGERGQGGRPAEVHWPVGQARGGLGVWATVGPASFFGK